MSQIGKEQEEIQVEPLTLPKREPVEQPQPLEPVKVPA
jgi:hypothetical protein